LHVSCVEQVPQLTLPAELLTVPQFMSPQVGGCTEPTHRFRGYQARC
jgi:hypothetical protein